MPYASERQRFYLRANKPEVARQFERHSERVSGKLRDGLMIHTLLFDKGSFPKKQNVQQWTRTKAQGLNLRNGAIIDGPASWQIRQGSPDISGMEQMRVQCDAGVSAIVGMPRPDDVGKSMLMLKAIGISPLPLMPPIGGASGPADRTPAMPDWYSIYFQPEAQKRQQKEGEQSRDRRRAAWRDYNFMGFHGTGTPDTPILRYVDGETSTADMAIKPNRHYMTAAQLRQNQLRIQQGAVIGYPVAQGQPKPRKKGKV